MPAIRDYSQSYTSTAANALVVAPPVCQTNDLLVALCSSDTAAANALWYGGRAMTSWFQDSAGTFTDYSAASQSVATGDCFFTSTTPAANHACYFGHSERFNGLSVILSTAPSISMTWVWEYWDGSAWSTLTTLFNNILTSMAVGGRALRFNPPTNWATTTVNSVSQYWIRMRISAYTSQTTRPAFTQGWVGIFNELGTINNSTTSGQQYLFRVVASGDTALQDLNFQENAGGSVKQVSIISVRDIDTSIPFCTQAGASYSESNRDSDQAVGNGTTTGVSQSFTSESVLTSLATVKLYLKKNGSPTGNAVVKLYAHSGTLGTSSVPTGTALAISDNYNVANLTTSYQLIEFTFPWYYQYQFAVSTNYCIAIEYSGGDASNYVQVGYDASTPSHGGNKATFASAVWSASSGQDVCFYVNRWAFSTATGTTTTLTMPTMTTLRDDSMVLWGGSTEAVQSVPSILEGALTMIHAKEGNASADCMSWGWKKTAGTTAAPTMTRLLTASLSNTGFVCAINPPSGGATVIPAYCSNDASVYITPLTGAAFKTDTAPATTVTSAFGSTLNGKTLSATAAALTLADVGVNSYHAKWQCGGLTTDGSWAGTRHTIASRNLASKNILIHGAPVSPLHVQTTNYVNRPGVCGVAFGFASTANTNYKVWHVGGAGTPLGDSIHQPWVINTDYTGAGMIQNTGTLSPTAVVELGFFVSSYLVIANWHVGSMWALDTVTVAGGNSTEPVDIPGLVRSAATGYERRNLVQQGAAQAVCYGPVQIGDGGTNPVYLDLNATALEFPRQYSVANKQVNYCSIDNVCGLKYYPGSSDTIKHRNSVISSASRYFWGLHASASTSATYDFSGLSVIGAGTITLGKAITITSLTISDYSTLDLTDLALVSGTVKSVPTANDSATITTGTTLTSCTIDVSMVTVGNRWASVAGLPTLTGCTFTGGGGHAFRITSPGTYTITNCTWNSFGADGSTGAAIYNDSGGVVTLNLSGGTTPTVKNGAGASTTTAPAAVDTTITVVSATTGSAIASARVLVTASNGSGTMPYQKSTTITRSGSTATAACTAHGLVSGTKALVQGADQQEYNGVVTITVVDADTFTYTVSGTPTTPATGTIITTGVVIDGTTNGSGVITDNRSHLINQPITGRVRKSTSSPLYKTGAITGTISYTAGFSATVQLVPDE